MSRTWRCEFYPNFTYIPIFPKKSKTSLMLLMLFFQLQMISFRPILALTLPSTPEVSTTTIHYISLTIFSGNEKPKLQQWTLELNMKQDFTHSVFSLQWWKRAKWLCSAWTTFNLKMSTSEINLSTVEISVLSTVEIFVREWQIHI